MQSAELWWNWFPADGDSSSKILTRVFPFGPRGSLTFCCSLKIFKLEQTTKIFEQRTSSYLPACNVPPADRKIFSMNNQTTGVTKFDWGSDVAVGGWKAPVQTVHAGHGSPNTSWFNFTLGIWRFNALLLKLSGDWKPSVQHFAPLFNEEMLSEPNKSAVMIMEPLYMVTQE